jgi:drug/metabolite transporter (DMT)-like permease
MGDIKIFMKNYKYILLLIIVTFFMGAEFPVIKIGLETVPPLLFIGIRFLIAGLILFIFYFNRIKSAFKKDIIIPALILSIFLFMGFLTANFGIKYTTATNSGFYISLVVLFTPILGWLIFKKSMAKEVLISIAIIVVGIYLISTDSGTMSFNTGDMLCLLSAIFYSLQIIFTALYVTRHNPLVISLLQIGFVSILGFCGSLVFETLPKVSSIGLQGWMSLIFTGILATAFVYTVQSFAQTVVPPSNIGIIYSFEPVFSAVLSFIMLGEKLGIKGIIGGSFIVTSAIIYNILSYNSNDNCIDINYKDEVSL